MALRKHILFFVHGMGVYKDGLPEAGKDWFAVSLAALQGEYAKYKDLAAFYPFDKTFEIVNINYDLIFHSIVTRWAEESAKVGAAVGANNHTIASLVGWLTKANNTEDFIWSHAVDVALYRFFPTVRQRVKANVALKIFNALQANDSGPVSRWSVIAHSLGTIVTHDVLHAMDTTTPKEAGVPVLESTAPSAQLVAMVANVSKAMENDVKVYDGPVNGGTHVIPRNNLQDDTVCEEYLNINNRFDPFTIPIPFSPGTDSRWREADRIKRYEDVSVDHVHGITNVHGFDHYIANPAAHIPIFRALTGNSMISEAEERDARKNFKKYSADDIEGKIKKRLEETVGKVVGKSLEAMLPELGRFFMGKSQ